MAIDRLRRELARIDRKVLEAVARRNRLAEKLGRAKQAAGLDLRDFRQEKEVLERARRTATELGLAESLAEELTRLLVAQALTAQERQRLVARGGGVGRNALVIGGGGRMGGWFVRFLASQGWAVEVADPAGGVAGFPHRADWRRSSLDQDLILVAADLRATGQILEGLAARRPRGLVLDIGSLKKPLEPGLSALAEAGVRASSLHPMFGPDTELLSGRHVIFVELGDAEAREAAEALFASTMAERVRMGLEEHDRLVSFVLGLSHALNIAFFTALAESGESVPRLAGLSSTTFDDQLAVARRVAGENPHLYFEIQHSNDFGEESLRALESAVSRLCTIVTEGDESGFVALMEAGRQYFARRDHG